MNLHKLSLKFRFHECVVQYYSAMSRYTLNMFVLL
jgi:hypothetical protein